MSACGKCHGISCSNAFTYDVTEDDGDDYDELAEDGNIFDNLIDIDI